MDDRRAGAILRALRRRNGFRQRDVAAIARCHQTTVSRAERGDLEQLSLAALRRLYGAVGARFDGEVRWRGGDVDRLLDAEHAHIVDAVSVTLRRWGWSAVPEVSFSEYGDRGSIDLLAAHAASRLVAVFEIKSAINAVDETLRRHDVKTRIAPKVATERFGWRPSAVIRVLVVPDATATRSAVARHAATFASSYPMTGRAVRALLRRPAADVDARQNSGGVWFLTVKNPEIGKRKSAARHRVRRPQVSGGRA